MLRPGSGVVEVLLGRDLSHRGVGVVLEPPPAGGGRIPVQQPEHFVLLFDQIYVDRTSAEVSGLFLRNKHQLNVMPSCF